jgi:fatty acid desaturase
MKSLSFALRNSRDQMTMIHLIKALGSTSLSFFCITYLWAADLPPFIRGASTLALAWLHWKQVSNVNFVLHNHVHRRIFLNERTNRAFDLICGMLSGMLSYSWRITHRDAHHSSHLKIPGRWYPLDSIPRQSDNYSPLEALKGALYTVFPQAVGYLIYSFKNSRRRFRGVYFRAAVIEAFSVLLVAIALAVYSPIAFVAVFLLPWMFVHFSSKYIDQLFHLGGSEKHDYLFCFNCVDLKFNCWAYGAGYHLAHHRSPRLHWSLLENEDRVLCAAYPYLKHMRLDYNFSVKYLSCHYMSERGIPRTERLFEAIKATRP